MLELSFPGWSAAFTGREEGDLRIGGRSGGEPLAAVQQRVLDQLGLGAVVAAHQVHGAEVVVVERAHDGYSVAIAEADGVVTAARGLAPGCTPPTACRSPSPARARWRCSTAAGGGSRRDHREGREALRELAGESELQAVIGPGAGGCCYETGEEVRALFSRLRRAADAARPQGGRRGTAARSRRRVRR